MVEEKGKRFQPQRKRQTGSSQTGKSHTVSGQTGRPRGSHEGKGGGTSRAARPAAALPAGLLSRELAVDLVTGVLRDGRGLDDVMAQGFAAPAYADLEPRDRGLARAVAATTLRWARPLQETVAGHLKKPLPAKFARVGVVLIAASAQLLVLRMPAHAVINLAVDQVRRQRNAAHLTGLVNAVLRKVASGEHPGWGPESAFPAWMMRRWRATYGDDDARRIAEASLREAALDLSLKEPGSASEWAERLGGAVLATGTLRLASAGRVDELAGFAEGAWWVQDAAAALPARLLGDVTGLAIADLCAAPGGKTAELAALGANVTAVDVSEDRIARVAANLARLGLAADLVVADATAWTPERQFDAVLLDAPCTATGTIRRHPDILHLKRPDDLTALAGLQEQLLANAARLVRPGGRLVYCTCSLEPEEGEARIDAFLSDHAEFRRIPIVAGEGRIDGEWITTAGDLRTLPFHTPPTGGPADPSATGDDATTVHIPGMDGFFAARLERGG